MADKQIYELTEDTTPSATDVIAGQDAAGASEAVKYQVANVHKGMTAASTTVASVIEIATGAETNTGTDATRAVSPDALDDWTGSAQITTVGTLSGATIDADNNTVSNIELGAEATGASTDLTDTADLTYNADADVSGNTWTIDEDNMASDLDTKVPTQQSVKAYSDTHFADTTTHGTSGAITGISDTQTLTNKRVTPRVSTEASAAEPTINTDNVEAHSITALAAAITSMTTNLSGTPTNFQKLIIRILDNGTARCGQAFAIKRA